jgi:hypothetical protein
MLHQLKSLTGIALALLLPTAANAKPARCVIQSGTERYAGPCQFRSERGGSFTLSPVKGRRHILYVTSLSVAVQGDGKAEVRGLTDDGINSMWGHVTRSRKDRACWEGLDLKVCAY